MWFDTLPVRNVEFVLASSPRTDVRARVAETLGRNRFTEQVARLAQGCGGAGPHSALSNWNIMLLLAVSLTLANPAQGPADRALDAAISAYSHVRTAKAHFNQVISNPLTGQTLRSEGDFEQQRPDKFAFRFSDPKGDLILSDGKFVWLYLPSSTPGQVIRQALAKGPAGSLDIIGEFFTNPRTRYVVSDGGAVTLDGQSARIVKLVPRQSDAAFSQARVWIDPADGSLLQFEAAENTGVTRRVRITSFAANVDLSPAAFSYKPPKGIRVVDGNTLRGDS